MSSSATSALRSTSRDEHHDVALGRAGRASAVLVLVRLRFFEADHVMNSAISILATPQLFYPCSPDTFRQMAEAVIAFMASSSAL